MAGVYNLTIEQGATFKRTFFWRDENGNLINLSGYSARMKIKQDPTQTTSIISLTNGAGITLGGAAGTIEVLIPDADTTGLVAGFYYYDLEVDSGAEVTRLLQGKVTVSPEITS